MINNVNHPTSVRKPYQSSTGPWFVVEYETKGKISSKAFWDIVKAYKFYKSLSK